MTVSDNKPNIEELSKKYRKAIRQEGRVYFNDIEVYNAVNTYNVSQIVNMLMHGIDPDEIKNQHGTTALMAAIVNNDLLMVEKLIFHGADVNLNKNPAYLYVSIEASNYGISKLLLENNASIDDIEPTTHNTLLHVAIKQSMANLVNLLLEHGSDPNAKNLTGDTPLHTALKAQGINMLYVSALLEAGADPTIKNNHGYSAVGIIEHNQNKQSWIKHNDADKILSLFQKNILISDSRSRGLVR